MAEMYQALKAEGAAGFHFVSNSPNELLPVIRECRKAGLNLLLTHDSPESFFRHHGFPEGYSLMVSLPLFQELDRY